MTRGRWIVGLAVLLVLAGCGTGEADGVAVAQGKADAAGLDREHQQAREALVRFDEALARSGGRQRFVPVGELTGQVGDWAEPKGSNNKRALGAGRLVATVRLSDASPPAGTISWTSGSTLTVPVDSAATTFKRLTARGGDCGGCTPIDVTGARLTTAKIQTTRGAATAPAWEYTLKGTAVRVTQVAVAGATEVTVTPPSWNPYDAPQGLSISSAATNAVGRRLTVTFTGAPGPGSERCGADYTAEAVESANAVVVLVHAVPGPSDAEPEMCALMGAARTAAVDLARPLDGRAVLEVMQGLPVPITIG
jgi:hypothetical protein